MLCSRYLLRNTYTCEKISILCKCTNDESTHIFKRLNSENKYLYGSLLESQKERKKTAKKGEELVPAVKKTIFSDEDVRSNTANVENEATTKKQKKRKSNVTSHCTTTSSKALMQDVIKNTNLQNLESALPNQEPCTKNAITKNTKTVKRNKKSSPSIVRNDSSLVSNTKLESSDKFVFQTTVPINETNYPLDNPERFKLFSEDTLIENVLKYSFTDPMVKPYINFPSVSKIMVETMSDKNKVILNKWRQNMINDLGEDSFYKHTADLKSRGHEFHEAVRNAVLGKPLDNCSKITQKALSSLSWMLKHISNPMAVESIIAHPQLGYKGMTDCVAMFRNVPVVIDWKLSDKPKKDLKDTYEAPVQITAYIGALNHDPNYKWKVNHGLVAVAYSNGDPCDVFLLAPKHCQIYWRHWLMRVNKFMARSHLHLDHDIDEKALELELDTRRS